MTNSTQKLTVGLIGCGRMGARTDERVRKTVPQGWLPLSHAEAIRSIDDLELVALCDTNEESLEWAASTYRVDHLFTEYKELITEIKPNILSIATRTPGRCDIIEFAAEHGVKGIHSEKPLGQNMAECKRGLAAVEKNGVKLTYGTLRRFMDTYRRAKDLVASGEIGDLVEICIEHGRTLLMWNHPHSVDLLVFFSDCTDVEYVQASCVIGKSPSNNNVVDDDPVVENAFVKFKNGISGVITSCSGLNTRLSGTQGTLTIVGDGSWIELHTKTDKRSPYHLNAQKWNMQPTPSGSQKAFLELSRAVIGSEPLSISLEEIALAQRILFSFVLSSLEGGIRVNPSNLLDDFRVTGKCGLYYA